MTCSITSLKISFDAKQASEKVSGFQAFGISELQVRGWEAIDNSISPYSCTFCIFHLECPLSILIHLENSYAMFVAQFQEHQSQETVPHYLGSWVLPPLSFTRHLQEHLCFSKSHIDCVHMQKEHLSLEPEG